MHFCFLARVAWMHTLRIIYHDIQSSSSLQRNIIPLGKHTYKMQGIISCVLHTYPKVHKFSLYLMSEDWVGFDRGTFISSLIKKIIFHWYSTYQIFWNPYYKWNAIGGDLLYGFQNCVVIVGVGAKVVSDMTLSVSHPHQSF